MSPAADRTGVPAAGPRGLAMRPDARVGPARPIDEQTRLAITRTVVALDRTLAAWVRTAVTLITFGFTVYTFFQYLWRDPVVAGTPVLTPRGFALALIGLGSGGLFVATVEYWRQVRAMRERFPDYGPCSAALAPAIATVVCGLGALTFILVFLHR